MRISHEKKGWKQEYCGLVNLPHMRDMYGLFYDEKEGVYKGIVRKDSTNEVLTSSIAKEIEPDAILFFNKDGYTKYCKDYKEYWEWVEKRNEVRYENTISHAKNYDAKNMMHTFRLLDMAIEIELGVTGGEEDGVDNSDVDSSKLYTQPEEVAYAYSQLKEIGDLFTIAAAFGNVHGVYKPGNVSLKPIILKNSQEYINQNFGTTGKPLNFVFHGGSGSSVEEIREANSYGSIKMNIDTDMQWAMWEGILNYYKKNEGYLQSQLGNPEGADSPNKKYYDPRVWLRKGEENFVKRLELAFDMLNAVNRN